MKMKNLIYKLFNDQLHMVLSTVNKNGNPQSATVGFGHTRDLELVFGTNISTRKAANLQKNKNVSLVINGHEVTVQYEGVVSRLEGVELSKFKKLLFKKLPGVRKYENLPGQVYFKITPVWIRHTDHKTTPGKVVEITF